MKVITAPKPLFLGVFLILFIHTTAFAQWKKQNLPPLDDMLYFPFAKGKKVMWARTVNYAQDTTHTGRLESIRTTDGGKTYKTQILFDDINGYDCAIYPFNDNTAYMVAAKLSEPVYYFRRTVDTGATWQDMSYQPTTFPDIVHFFDENDGVLLSDPDSIGANIVYTSDGGNTFTRLPQTNVPAMDVNSEFFIIGGNLQVIGNTLFTTSVNFTNGLWRVWRSTDRGRNWTAGEWFDTGPFIPRVTYTDDNNGMIQRGVSTISGTSLYTHDGGATWQEGFQMPGLNTFYLNTIPKTETIFSVFMDTDRTMLFSAATNDLGKTWHSQKDIMTYEPDSIFYPDIPPFVYSLGDIVDNNTAWAKFGREGLYRYESTTPLVSELPDLDLQLTADNDGLPLYGSVKYTLTVKNRGISPATGVKINWLPPYKRTNNGAGAFAYQSAYASTGWYDSWNGVWSVDQLNGGASATATFHLFVVDNTKDVTQTAQVIATNETDLDSSPNNMSGAAKEDDEVGYISHTNNVGTIRFEPHKEKMIDFAISPNPAVDKLTIAIYPATEKDWSVRVLNSIGQTVISQKGQNTQLLDLDVKNLEAGLYIVEYLSDGDRKIEKVLIQH